MGVKEFSSLYQFEKIIMGTYENDLELNNKFKDKESIISLTPIATENYAENNLISLMLSYGLQSPFMNELREKRGLSYGVSLLIDNLNDFQYYIYQTIQTKKGNGEEIIKITKEILLNPDKYLTKKRFDLIKNLLFITYKKYEIERYKNINKFIKQPHFLIEDKLDSITYDRIREVYPKIYNPNDWYFSIDHNEFK